MVSGQSSVVWFTEEKKRFFLLPEDQNKTDIADGTLTLCAVGNRQQSVDPAALTPYEITRDEAEAWLKAQLGDVLGELRGNLIDAARAYFDRRKPSAHESPAELVDHAAAIETVAAWLQPLSARAEARLRAKAAALRKQADRETSRGDADA